MKNNSAIAYILLGSNIGNRSKHLKEAAKELENQFPVISRSGIYETAAWGDRSQDAYLNQVISIEVGISPAVLHTVTRQIEKSMGRNEKGNYKPRIIDIDILFHGNAIVHTKQLTIPHPRIQIRRFVLVPLCEIAANLRHPILEKTIEELLKDCEDQLEVMIYTPG